ncbi:alpha/beta hydrolase [Mycobacterium deserti]|uniref:Alpha/beta hydrolase n=1 Tax=Mycobacterium deserti TaxID=2978347 RepID=A0ABT2MAF4_9MYCO|nr:alpha/beta hydrolase [Mycobacterium deserti]MCT7659232.1 alpha/beta hydrolase [Mycobacterium deserti]
MASSLPKEPAKAPARREAMVNAAAGMSLRAMPRIPDPVKRLLLGGRSLTIDGNTLDTTLHLMLTAQKVAGLDGLVGSDDVGTARAQLEALSAGFKQNIAVGAVTNLSILGPAGDIRARHYRPPHDAHRGRERGTDPLLVFFHGGGQVIGSIETHDDLCRQICRTGGMHVLSVDYRLAPEHKAPAGSADAFAAYLWALENAAALGADPSRVGVGGDSAGANQAALVAHRARDEGAQRPALQLLLYPVTNYRDETRSQTLFAEGFFLTKRDLNWFRDHYLGGAEVDASDPAVSPLLADDLSGLAPAMVVTAGFDPLRDEGEQYARAMRSAGVTVDYREFGSLVHGFANFFPLGGGSATAMAQVISALRAHLCRG